MAQRQHLGSCKSESESSREDRLRNPPHNPAGRAAAKGGTGSVFCRKQHAPHGSWKLSNCLTGDGHSDSLVCSKTPLSFYRSLQAAGALMGFRCLSCVCTILIGLALSLGGGGGRGKESPCPLGWQRLAQSRQWRL